MLSTPFAGRSLLINARVPTQDSARSPDFSKPKVGLFPLTVTVTTRGNKDYSSPLNKVPFKDSYWVGE